MSIDKHVLSFDQLDTLLLESKEFIHRPVSASNAWNKVGRVARVYRNLYARGFHSHCISLMYLAKDPEKSWPLAYVRRTTGGDSVYSVPCSQFRKRRNSPAPPGYDDWKDWAEQFTPYVRADGASVDDLHYYVAANGATRRLAPWPTEWHECASIRASAEPSASEWVAKATALRNKRQVQLRARRFFSRVQRELDGLVYSVRRLNRGNQYWFHHDQAAVRLAVTPFGRNGAEQECLTVEVGEHTDYTRKGKWHLDGDYTRKHILVVAMDKAAAKSLAGPGVMWRDHWASPAGDPAKGVRLWKCASDAVVGIKDWVMDQLVIPGI